MNAASKSPCISSFYFTFFLLVVLALFRLCLSTENNDDVLCLDNERQALVQFKDSLIDETDQLASWAGEKSDCCKWAGILCDNITGHVLQIHLSGNCDIGYDATTIQYEVAITQRLRGDISPSILNLKQLEHLDLSCNDFNGIQIPNFIGSLGNLRYLNLSHSWFGGTIPPRVGNLTQLRILCLGSYAHPLEITNVVNMQWLSNLQFLSHLDMSSVNLTKATDWLQVICTLPSLVELHLSYTGLPDIPPPPHVTYLNLTSLSLLDLSGNDFKNNFMPHWIFSITKLVSLHLRSCHLHGPISSTVFHNLTSLKFLDMARNEFMSSSLVLKSLSSIGGNMILLDISDCGVSSPALDSLHNLTSLLTLNIYGNQLTNAIPESLGNLCNLRHIDMSRNYFPNISLTNLLERFLDCKSPSLELLSLEASWLSSPLPDQLGRLIKLVHLELSRNTITGPIPDSIGRLSFLRYLDLHDNLISGPTPYSVGGLFSLEFLDLSDNQLNDTLPESLAQLSKLKTLDLSNNFLSGPIPFLVGELLSLEFLHLSNNQLSDTLPESLGQLSKLKFLGLSNNSLTGVMTESHFSKLSRLKYLDGMGNDLTLRPHQENWIPSFQLEILDLSSWDLGPQFPLWLLSQRDLIELELRDTGISSTMPESFWKLFPNLISLDMSQNQMHGRLFDIPARLVQVDLSSNLFSGKLPNLYNSSVLNLLDLSNNSFIGSLHDLLCPYGGKELKALNLANNQLTGVIPECWVKWPSLSFLNLENNNLSSKIPTTLGSLSSLKSLNMCNNKLSGRLPASLKKLASLEILQFATNELVGSIPAWIGTELSSLRILNLRSNNFEGKITYELCYLTSIQILDFADNNLSGNIPTCFNNFSVLSKKETPVMDHFYFFSIGKTVVKGSASLVTKGQEYTYSTILGLVMILDLSGNNFTGSIPVELTTLLALQSLNLSKNQLTGRIPEHIGDLKLLESFDVSLNHLSGALPSSLSHLSFLSSFNVSFNSLTGRIPSSTQLQSFYESSFVGNKLCGLPLTKLCGGVVHQRDQQEGDKHGVDFGLIISILLGFFVGFWGIVAMCVGAVQSLVRKIEVHVLCRLS